MITFREFWQVGAALLLALSATACLAVVPGDDFTKKKVAAAPGAAVFAAHCTSCHDHGGDHAPPLNILHLMSALSVREALISGAMRQHGLDLSDLEKTQVAEFISGAKLGAGKPQPPAPLCRGRAAAFDFDEPPVFPGWGLELGNRRHESTELAGLDKKNLGKLHLKWAFAFPDSLRARSLPALAGGSIFVGSHSGAVFALDRDSGCVRWRFDAPAEVRTGLVVSPWQKGDRAAVPLVYFGDLIGNLFALDAKTGALVWRQRPDDNPATTLTAAPALFQDRLYVPVSSLEEANIAPSYECCKFRGSVVAFDARSGSRLWQTYLTPPPQIVGKNDAGTDIYAPSGVAVWNTPAIDAKRGQLTIGTGDNYSSPGTADSDSIVALDLAGGAVKWVHQSLGGDAWNSGCEVTPRSLCPAEDGPDYDFGAATILATASDGKDIVLGGQKSGDVVAVDPDDGHRLWDTKVGRGGILAGVYFGMAVSGDRVFVPISDMPDGRSYKDPARPGLYALDLRTGNTLWQAPASPQACDGRPACFPGIAGSITATPELVLVGASDGWIRIYDTNSGEVLWRFDSARSFKAVGGGTAKGGSIGGGAAPIAYHGSLIVPSGYGFVGQRPGNALLVFSTTP